jgi:hypothetical protein
VFACAVTSEGTPIRAQKGMDDELTQKYAQNISILTKQARHAIRELDSAVRPTLSASPATVTDC